MTEWEEIFGEDSVPEWILYFNHDPFGALDAALWRKHYFGPLHVVDPADLLIDWSIKIGQHIGFVEKLDHALSQWIERTWQHEPRLDGQNTAVATAIAWISLADVVANVDSLQHAPDTLRRYFDERQAYLGPLSQGPSRDPLGRYLYAVAKYQKTRELLPVWWNYCDLAQGIPVHHGFYGVWGLRRLPDGGEQHYQGLPEHVALGLAKLASSLYRRSLDDAISRTAAKAEFQRVAHITIAAYPFPEQWREYWKSFLTTHLTQEEPVKWMNLVVPGINEADNRRNVPVKYRKLAPSLDWPHEAGRIADLLASNAALAIDKAMSLLEEQRKYAADTGDGHYLNRTLTRFAKVVTKSNPEQAVEWAEEARLWEPWNAITCAVLIEAMGQNVYKDAQAALGLAWEAVERFPNNPVIRNDLAQLLKKTGSLKEAERVYREAVKLFPNDAYARSGLAQVLKESGNLREAERVYREAVKLFPNDAYARNGLAEVLRELSNLREAERVYRETIKLFPNDTYARNGLASVLRLLGGDQLEEADEQVNRTLEQDPTDVMALAEKGRILEAKGNIDDAATAFEQAIKPILEDIDQPKDYEEQAEDQETLKEARRELQRVTESGTPSTEKIEGHERDLNKEHGGKSENLPSDKEKAIPTIKKERAAPHRSKAELIILSSYARFLRRWARINAQEGGQPSPTELRNRALKMLEIILSAKPLHSRALMEKALLLLECEQFEDAKEFLTASIELRPHDHALRYALARTEREIASYKGTHLRQVNIDTVNAEWKHLRSINPDLRPLVLLGEGRTWLAYLDGQTVSSKALLSFQKMRKWMRPHLSYIGNGESVRKDDPESVRRLYKTPEGFQEWWSREIQANLFGLINIENDLKEEDIDVIRERMKDYALPLDTLEEDFTIRLSF